MSVMQELQSLAEEAGLKLTVADEETAAVDCQLSGGRGQKVIVSNTGAWEQTAIIAFWTPVAKLSGRLSGQLATRLLEKNRTMPIGSLRLLSMPGSGSLLSFGHHVQMRSLDSELFAAVVTAIATLGDSYEAQFGDEDVF